MDIRRAPAHSETKLPTDQFIASEGGSDDDKSRLYIAGAGLLVAGAAAAGAIWLTNNVEVPDTPPIQIEAPQTSRERVDPQPIIRREAPVRQQQPHWQPRQDVYTPRPSLPGPTINSDGTVALPLGRSGVSIDTDGRLGVDVGGGTLRSDGTIGLKLNENITINSDGTFGFQLGGRR